MIKFTRIRAGFYTVKVHEVTWTVEQRRVDPAWGGGWAWFATSDDGAVMDPMPTMRDVRSCIHWMHDNPTAV
jgi:hypothetical protein